MAIEKRCPVKHALRTIFVPWPSAHNVLLLLTAIFLLSLVSLTASEWASWVQAIGSILAIVGALAVSRSQASIQNAIAFGQIQHQIDMKKQEATDRALSFFAVVDCAATLCDAIYKTAADDDSPKMMKAVWSAHLREVAQASLYALREIPVYELGSYELVVGHGTVLATFVKFISEVEIVVEGGRSIDVPETMGIFGGMKHQNALMQAGFGTFKDAHRAKYGELPT